jgi:N-acetylglucosaminyl-diphospho-decaprenol L-rhamnosyltransferase
LATATLSIVSHGHGRLVSQLLRDLTSQTIAAQIDVVLTLNVPEDDPDPDCHRGLNLLICRNSRPKGFGANHNAALRASSTPWVMIVNPDIRIHDHTLLERLLKHHSAGEVGLVAPLIRNPQGGREDSVRHNLDPISLLGRRLLGRSVIVDPNADDRRFCWIAGMFMALPLRTWKAVGGFDERFFLYCEDYDLCARIAIRGDPIMIDETLEIIHDARRSSRWSLRYLRWHLASILRVWTSAHFWRIWSSELRLSPAIRSSRRYDPRTSSRAIGSKREN